MPAAFEALRRAALAHPGVEEKVACRGTALESASFRVGGKAFLFLSPGKAMVKLDGSREEASEIAACKTGAGGWTTVDLASDEAPATSLLVRWVAESRALFAAGAAKPKRRRS